MRGEYIHMNSGLVIPNNLTRQGEQAFLRMIGQARVADVASAGNFYVGLMEDNFSKNKTLADIVGEPTGAGGYARQAVTRDAAGWPVVDDVNDIDFIETADIEFAAVAANYSTAVGRLFLCNAASGAGGLLFSVSSALPNPLQIVDGQTQIFRYRLYMR